MVASVERAARAKFFEQRDGERGAFLRRSARAHFVHQNQRAVGDDLEHGFQIQHVRRKCGKVRGDGLLVADIREHAVEDRASRRARAATGIPDCAESAARPTVFSATVLPPVFGPLMTSTVSSPPSASVIGTAARPCGRSVASSTGLRADSSRSEFPAVNSGIDAIELPRKSRARENRIEMRDGRGRALRAGRARRARGWSALQNARDFGRFFLAELHQAIIQINRLKRLDEHRLPRRARRVHHARNAAAIGSAHRNHEAVVAQRDVVLARRFAARAQDAFERLADRVARLRSCRRECA